MGSAPGPRHDRPLAEQHEEWTAHLRRHAVSRRTVVRGSIGAAAASLLLGPGLWSDRAVAATLAAAGTVAGGFLVNGRHLSFGNDPRREMWVGGQLFNIHTYNAVPPKSLKVWLEYGTDRFYGHAVEAEVRELLTHVPVWDGKPGVLKASRTLNADQFFVHAYLRYLSPGHPVPLPLPLRRQRRAGRDGRRHLHDRPRPGRRAVHLHCVRRRGHPRPVPGPRQVAAARVRLGRVEQRVVRLRRPRQPVPHQGEHHLRGDPGDHQGPQPGQRHPSRFNLQAGDLCYAQAQGDIQPIINPDGPDGSQPDTKNTPQPAAGSGGWDYYDPWVWTSWFPMIEASAANIPWMVTTGNHEPELFSTKVAAGAETVDAYGPLGYGGLTQRMDLPTTGPSACPSVYSFAYGSVGVISLDANELSWEIQGLLGYSKGAGQLAGAAAVGLAGRPAD